MKIWLDFCEPKSITMLRPLYNRLIKEHQVFITARDFDATYALLDDWGVPYYKCGKYGGADLVGKLKSYSSRLSDLIDIVAQEKPDFLFCITSPEAIRVAFGLQLPHIMFNDEPRSFGCSSLTLPLIGVEPPDSHRNTARYVIVPKPFNPELYHNYGVREPILVRFHGIDEVAWLNQTDFHPDPKYSIALGLSPENYFVFRTEATQSYAHLTTRLQPHETILTDVIPKLLESLKSKSKAYKFLILPRYQEQYDHLSQVFESEIKAGLIILKKNVSHLADIMFYASIVISGGGTMVRESALLGVPSIEFIPTETYPQEQFLMDNGFPLVHVKTAEKILNAIENYLITPKRSETWVKIAQLENPIEIAINLFKKVMKLN